MSKPDLRTYLITLVQLGLVGLAVQLLEIEEGGGLPGVMVLLTAGYAVHAHLPRRLASPWFLALSVASLFLVMGSMATWLLALGIGLFVLCHLPIPLGARMLLVLVAGGVLAVFRTGAWEAPWGSAVIPILSAMLMFRIVLYLQDQRLKGEPVSIWRRLSYFFMVPNVCFPLFPVVDFTTYRRSYLQGDQGALHRKGMHWLTRGVVQLLAYRVVYHLLLPAPAEVDDAASMLQFIITGYGLYLRISGQFHLIVGILLLFGFDLPETHKKYYLASGFNDYWRRVNIYWKDFIEKVVFYPVFLRVNRWKVPQPMVVAILITFVATWLLHSYQWFWLQGDFPITPMDALFWGILGVAVAFNSILESRGRRRRPAATGEFVLRDAALVSLKTVGMFCFLAVLWKLWYADSLAAFARNMKLLTVEPTGLLWAAAFVVTAFTAGIVVPWIRTRQAVASTLEGLDPQRNHGVGLLVTVGLVGLGYVGQSTTDLGRAQTLVSAVTEEKLNEQDRTTQTRGYYETLLSRASFTGALWRTSTEKPADWLKIADTEYMEEASDDLVIHLKPSFSSTFLRQPMSTNSHRMRDQEYTVQKPPGTYRIALLGSSYSMGSGVADGENYESLVEIELNEKHTGNGYDRYEILNFAVAGYSHARQIAVYREKIRRFQPDAVFLADHSTEGNRIVDDFGRYPWIMEDHAAKRVRNQQFEYAIFRDTPEDEVIRLLTPVKARMTIGIFETFAADVRADGAIPVLLYVPLNRPVLDKTREILERREQWATEAGMLNLSLAGAYGDHGEEEIAIAPWDEHPNRLGHRLLAKKLMQVLLDHDQELGLKLAR